MFRSRASILVFFILLTVGGLSKAWSYPEMVRHGYLNCMSCHVSVSGGGVLTDYGRVLSGELLSAWVKEEEPESKKEKWHWDVGGDIRGLQTYIDSPMATEGRFFLMQTDVEAAVNYDKKYFLVASAGFEDKSVSVDKDYKFISRRHYVNYRPQPKLSFRLGKFQHTYGLNLANHTRVTQRSLGWDEGSESYNMEGAWIGEKYDMFLTAVMGRPDDRSLKRETGVAWTSHLHFQDKHKVGLSYFNGKSEKYRRDVFGLHGVFGWTEHFFLLAELDYQVKDPISQGLKTEEGGVGFLRLNYEVSQGIHLYLPYQLSYLDFDSVDSRSDSYGIGFQYFPMMHLELNLEYSKIRSMVLGNRYDDLAWLMIHLYM